MSAILMTEEYWANTMFAPVRHYGEITVNGINYIIVNKEGKDIYQCSYEAEKAGREKAIEPGEPCDLIDKRYVPTYKKVGRDRFIQALEAGCNSIKEIENYCKKGGSK